MFTLIKNVIIFRIGTCFCLIIIYYISSEIILITDWSVSDVTSEEAAGICNFDFAGKLLIPGS